MKKLGFLVMVMCFVFTVSGCETVKGFGKDMQKAGEALADKASDKES
ncbi:MAG: entericidin A/B family lipoprotein [Gammaproteobacteria bacterium]|nr:entericidin A/B family lipoprotein [Gammaproteobacteria bacterium]